MYTDLVATKILLELVTFRKVDKWKEKQKQFSLSAQCPTLAIPCNVRFTRQTALESSVWRVCVCEKK